MSVSFCFLRFLLYKRCSDGVGLCRFYFSAFYVRVYFDFCENLRFLFFVLFLNVRHASLAFAHVFLQMLTVFNFAGSCFFYFLNPP